MMIDERRVRQIKGAIGEGSGEEKMREEETGSKVAVEKGSGVVVYWMRRDQRVDENWAFIHALQKALAYKVPLVVYFQIIQNYQYPYHRHFDFMLRGLEEVERRCHTLGVGTHITIGNGVADLIRFLQEVGASLLVTDHTPLRGPSSQITKLQDQVNIPIHVVDAHNVIPVWETSDKQEYSARTIRGKIYKLLDQFLVKFPEVDQLVARSKPPSFQTRFNKIDVEEIKSKLDLKPPAPVSWLTPGYEAGMSKLEDFITVKLANYAEKRNDPNEDSLSDLSPYLHFGQISAQEVVSQVLAIGNSGSEAFIEEILIRRELSENYCFYNENYDKFAGLPEWGKRTLEKHSMDTREHLYTLDELERGVTHDALWNSAQSQMIHTGKMHGYMRMYWAKKILEWTKTPQEAHRIAVYLNDKYELDGRDPNGYTGVAWAIGGLHDRPWVERQIFGNIRYMNYNGAKRKFDVDDYISRNSYNSK